MGLLVLVAICGCRPAAVTEDSAAQAEAESSAAHDDQLFQIAIRNLNQLEDYNGNEMLKPALDRLNRWASHQKPPAGWKPDPMLQTLPAPLRELAVVKALDTLEFRPRVAAGRWLDAAGGDLAARPLPLGPGQQLRPPGAGQAALRLDGP